MEASTQNSPSSDFHAVDDRTPVDVGKDAEISDTSVNSGMPAHDTAHGACGKTWKQRGNRTGHCGACHETFEGETVFDAHRVTNEAGERVCLPPTETKYAGVYLRLENGTWRGPKMSAKEIARRKAAL